MPLEISWLIPNHVIFNHASGKVTLEEMHTANVQLTAMLDAARQAGIARTHFINDARGVISQPNPITAHKALAFFSHPQLDWILIGGLGNPLLDYFVKTLSKLTGRNIKLLDNINAAFTFLAQQDPTLADELTTLLSTKEPRQDR